MSIQIFKLLGKEYVILPAKDYHRMAKELAAFRAELKSDIAVAKRRMKDPKEKPVPYEEARKRLGLV